MKLFALALEDEEEIIESEEELTDDEVIVDAEANAADVSEEIGEILEGEEILETTTEMADTVSEKIESGEGLDDTAIDLVAPALEHFYNKTGYKNNKIKNVSLEGFKNKDTRIEASKLVLEEIQAFNTRLGNNLNIAQEGIFSRAVNSIKLGFTSREKIATKLIDGIEAIGTRGAKDGLIKTPGWGRSFAIIGKKQLDGKDVLAYIERFNHLAKSNELYSVMDQYNKIVTSLATQVSKSLVFASDKATDEINNLLEDVDGLRAKINKLISSNDLKTAKSDPSFVSLDVDLAKKVGAVALEIIRNKKLDTEIDRLLSISEMSEIAIYESKESRLFNKYASDIRAAENVLKQLLPVIDEVLDIVMDANRICYACSNYIKSSTK